jgi:membrane-bound inhibitor of C-type lysozyme
MASKILLLSITVVFLASCSPTSKHINVANYVSEKDEVVSASYDIQAGTVQVTLPDKTQVRLYQAISASGARYTNQNATFWEHQGEATYSIGEKIVYVGRVK